MDERGWGSKGWWLGVEALDCQLPIPACPLQWEGWALGSQIQRRRGEGDT